MGFLFFPVWKKGIEGQPSAAYGLGGDFVDVPDLGNIAQAQQLSWSKRREVQAQTQALPEAIAVDGSNSYVAGSFTGTATFGAGD